MRPLLLASTLALCAVPLHAQPTLDAGILPQVGGHVNFVVTDFQTLSATGAGVTWNATNAVTLGTLPVDFVGPSTSSVADSFPTADLIELYGDGEFFVDVRPDGYYELGVYGGAPVSPTVYTDPLRMLALPCALDTEWTDAYAGSYVLSGQTHVVSGSHSYSANGYGTLQLPSGSVSNVLRVEEEGADTSVGGGSTHLVETHYIYFYKPGWPFIVAQCVDGIHSTNGNPSSSDHVFYYQEENTIGEQESAGLSLGVQVVPNPASEQALVLLTATGHGTLEVIDAQGHLQTRMDLGTLAAGISRVAIDVSQLPAGLYTAIVRNAEGEQGMAQFVVAR